MNKNVDKQYFECIKQFPLTEIEEHNYKQALKMLSSLMNRQLTRGEHAYRKVLERLILEHEAPYSQDLNNSEPHQLLLGLMELHDLTQAELAQALGCQQSFISAILRAQKSISEQTALKLGAYFKVDPNSFRRKLKLSASA